MSTCFNKYQELLSTPGLFNKIISCAGNIANNSGSTQLANILLRTDDGYPEALLSDTDYLLHQVAFCLRQHAGIVGSRICQDWSGEAHQSPEYVFSTKEKNLIHYVYEQHNSDLKDYNEELDFFGDEMYASFALAEAIRVIALYHPNLNNQPKLSLVEAVTFSVKVLPHKLNAELDVFNFCIKQIQNAIGQLHGDNAGMFFSDDVFFEKWEIQNNKEKHAALMEYCMYELAHL